MTPGEALAALPDGLRDDIINAFNRIVSNYRERRWEPAELNGGKLCEGIYTAIAGYVDGQYANRSSKPRDMVRACRELEQKPSSVPRAVKVQIPRMLLALYEIRNNRGVGHAGGDIDPNPMDATAVLYMSKWLMAELVRVFHDLTVEQASSLVENLIEREVPQVWAEGNRKRILIPGLTWKEKMLLLLLSENGPVRENDLFKWLEHPNVARFRRDVLLPAHKESLIDYEKDELTIRLLPPGVLKAEDLVRPT
ncbi:hypothetical protein GTU99_21255 [Streptomyces sp. PRKS01-65]|nr:hypothetical protein [Streptomyces harenosi]NEY34696.1 hypothetical protein [Streptomyces harenosi]